MLRLKHVHRDDGGLAAVVETDTQTAARGLFHDTPENRLDEVEGGFDADLTVLIDLALRPEWWESLPDPRTDIGGGSPDRSCCATMRGTRASCGRSTRLKWRGPVTQTVVEALIENGLPGWWEAERESFELGLGVGASECMRRLRPDEATTGITLTVIARGEPRDSDGIAEVNSEVLVGAFEADDGAVRYVHELRVDRALVNEAWQAVVGAIGALAVALITIVTVFKVVDGPRRRPHS